MPKERRNESNSASLRHDPLMKQIADDEARGTVVNGRKKKRKGAVARSGNEADEAEYMSSSLSRKTLELAREQQAEIASDVSGGATSGNAASAAAAAFRAGAGEAGNDSDASDDDDDAMDGGADSLVRFHGDMVEAEDMELDDADRRALAAFMGGGGGDFGSDDEDGMGGGGGGGDGGMCLADLIMEKIREKEDGDAMAAAGGGMDGGDESEFGDLPPKVVEVYRSIGKLLKRYRAGKLPKAFKIIPALMNWESVVWLTEPHEWSPASMYAATRIFASNMNPKMSQRFFNVFLLETVRDDIRDNHALNYHYYRALKKALYRPAAFYKGILLPLCEGGSCTLREAAIIGSVLTKVSIPLAHSAAALMRLAQMRYSGSNSIFIRILVDKKYNLPFSVIDALVAHFLRFTRETRQLPVLWHQSLLVFVQRFKNDITRAQKESFKELFKRHTHHQITPEVRRELFNARCRGEKAKIGGAASTGMQLG